MCTLSGNTASARGAGLYCDSSWLTLTNCEVSENAASSSGYGGGLYCNSSSAALTNCAIRGNNAGYDGGGAYFTSSGATLGNCVVSGNTARDGGGVYSKGYGYNTTFELANCTICANAARYGGGVYADYNRPKLTNCIVWGSTTHELYLYSGGSGVTYCDIRGGYPGTGNLNVDPLFVDPDGPDDDTNTWQDNDYRLAGGSPCIDAGSNAAVPADTVDLDADGDAMEPLPLDLDGGARFVDVPGWPDTGPGTPPIVDMGAYEVWVVWGDVNCDGGVDFDDIDPFILALGSHEAYGLAYPGCPYESADTNADGYVDFDDINPFVRCLVHEGCP